MHTAKLVEPNPGLSSGFNRYLRNLDMLLPRTIRKGDHGAHILQNTLQDIASVTPAAAAAIDGFLQACDQFRQQQFWIDEDHEYRDTASCWLPLLVLGKGWRDVVSSVLNVNVPGHFLVLAI